MVNILSRVWPCSRRHLPQATQPLDDNLLRVAYRNGVRGFIKGACVGVVIAPFIGRSVAMFCGVDIERLPRITQQMIKAHLSSPQYADRCDNLDFKSVPFIGYIAPIASYIAPPVFGMVGAAVESVVAVVKFFINRHHDVENA